MQSNCVVQIHDLVWSKPMTEIARQFGFCGQHMGRACNGADIVDPRTGYWQKVGHGKTGPQEQGSRRFKRGSRRHESGDGNAVHAAFEPAES
jgi:hypothetical protein